MNGIIGWQASPIMVMRPYVHRSIGGRSSTAQIKVSSTASISACLVKCDDVEAALKLYEAVRMPRTAQVQNGSWVNKTRFHMPDGPDVVERDALMA